MANELAPTQARPVVTRNLESPLRSLVGESRNFAFKNGLTRVIGRALLLAARQALS